MNIIVKQHRFDYLAGYAAAPPPTLLKFVTICVTGRTRRSRDIDWFSIFSRFSRFSVFLKDFPRIWIFKYIFKIPENSENREIQRMFVCLQNVYSITKNLELHFISKSEKWKSFSESIFIKLFSFLFNFFFSFIKQNKK